MVTPGNKEEKLYVFHSNILIPFYREIFERESRSVDENIQKLVKEERKKLYTDQPLLRESTNLNGHFNGSFSNGSFSAPRSVKQSKSRGTPRANCIKEVSPCTVVEFCSPDVKVI
jgi:hypothetical protein